MEKSEFQTFWKTAIHRYFNCECFQSKWYYAIVLLEINTPQSQSYQNLELKFFNASFPSNGRARFVKLTKLALYSSNQFLAVILQIIRRFLMTSRFLFCSDRFEETIMTNISQNEITERTVKAGFKLLATSRPDDPKIRLLMYAKLVSLFFSDTYRIYLTHRICSYYCKIMHYLMVLKSFGMVKWYFS